MSGELSIRSASPADAEALGRLVAELGYPAHPLADLVAEVSGRDDHLLQIAERDGRPLGYVLAHAHRRLGLGGTMVSLDELVVTASARGEGVGGALVGSARRWAEGRGALRFELITSRTLESYRAGFYEGRGFSEVASAVLRAPVVIPRAGEVGSEVGRDGHRRHFVLGPHGFLRRDGEGRSKVDAPCNKKLCFTSLRVEPLAAILYELSLREDCWRVKLDPRPRENGMVRGRCLLTREDAVGPVWRAYKLTKDVLCTIQDDDFTQSFRRA